MRALTALLPTLPLLVYLSWGGQITHPRRGQCFGNSPRLQRPFERQTDRQEPEEVQHPSISIALPSQKLSSKTPTVVELLIENTTNTSLQLSEPASFHLKMYEGDSERITEEFTASARLWECLPKAERNVDEGWAVIPGGNFKCEIDLVKLNWGRSKSSVYNISPTFPAGNLFHEVPAGSYKLFFGLQSPQSLSRGLPRVSLFHSNDISVSLEK